MATKSYKLRVDLRQGQPVADPKRFDSRSEEVAATHRFLDDTREAFNIGVDYLTGWLLKMHRGAGVWRERSNGIWREWNEVTSVAELEDVRRRAKAQPETFALLENRDLLDQLAARSGSGAVAVELAECCRALAKELCPPSDERDNKQMPRDALDLLLSPNSRALGLRSGPTQLEWLVWRLATETADSDKWQARMLASPELVDQPNCPTQHKQEPSKAAVRLKLAVRKIVKETLAGAGDWAAQGQALFDRLDRPEWLLFRVARSAATNATDLDAFTRSLNDQPEFTKAGGTVHEKAQKTLDSLLKIARPEVGESWAAARERVVAHVQRETAPYERLLAADCLPLPSFGSCPEKNSVSLGQLRLKNVESEWKRAMWNMAGQRVRSHLGWIRRRRAERLLWELRTKVFECGGWIRTARNGMRINRKDQTADDVRIGPPTAAEIGDFERQPSYAGREWVSILRKYESAEMLGHLEGIAFGAADGPRIRDRTIKGWSRVREKWIDLIKRAASRGKPTRSPSDLVEALNKLRKGNSRDFGDQRVFEWLAAPERRLLWDGLNHGESNECGRGDRDCVRAFVAYNEHLADEPASVTFTRTDAVRHPVWPFFGENSAIEYWLEREATLGGKTRLVLVLKQLLNRQADGSFAAADDVRIALRGYEDFEKSFPFPGDVARISPKQRLVFRDDLLGDASRDGTLGGAKLIWERSELEANRNARRPTKICPRVYATFSCGVGETDLPDWLTTKVGSKVKLKTPRDGMSRAFFLRKTITKETAADETSARVSPGEREWPVEAVENAFSVRGTDLGYRTSSAGAWWRLSFEKQQGAIARLAGRCGGRDVYALMARTDIVGLPGDGEPLPPAEESLRERLYSLRARLRLNNALLRAARLLTLESVTTRKRAGEKTRRRRDGRTRPAGIRWATEFTPLSNDQIAENVRSAAEQLMRWASTEPMAESLKAIRHVGQIWDWLAGRNPELEALRASLPRTDVPPESEANRLNIDREALKEKRRAEDDCFAAKAYELRSALAEALCWGYDAEKRKRTKGGLWHELDRALIRELSYGGRTGDAGERALLEDGLLRVLRKPPVTKHNDRKDINNLPHGRTHRGGLSIARLNFLDDVKNLVRRWSCRPRWPGDIRRIAKDAKFDRCDTEHLDHLREHRAKVIAHADVAQTLGFVQDLRRGLWRFRDASTGEMFWHRPERGHFYRERDGAIAQCPPPSGAAESGAYVPHPVDPRAHVLVYEDLTRYRMRSDRPKNENAGLARWSHRRILAFAQHIGGLFGVPVATIDARFSSRYCSHCGAPGCRAERFDPRWLTQRWMKRILESNDIADAGMKSTARKVQQDPRSQCWVLRDGGTHFVCANARCPVHRAPIDADENAAANIGLRFLRGIDGIRVTLDASGRIVRSVGYVHPKTALEPAPRPDAEEIPFWTSSVNAGTRARRAQSRGGDDSELTGEISDDGGDGGAGEKYLFRDPFGGFRSNDRWFEGARFWTDVKIACACGISAANAPTVQLDVDH